MSRTREKWHIFSRTLVLLLLSTLLCVDGNGKNVCKDFCSQSLYERGSSNHLRFSRENSDVDYGYISRYKAIHCCFYDYETIEWFKGGERLNEGSSSTVSSFNRFYCGNQTVASMGVERNDGGNYTCVAHGNNSQLTHTVTFHVNYTETFTGRPSWTIEPVNRWAMDGEHVRFMCEAFLGSPKNSLSSQVIWKRDSEAVFADEWPNREKRNNIKIDAQSRSDNTLQGKLMTIDPVHRHDFTQYTCFASVNGYIINKTVSLLYGHGPDIKMITSYRETLVVLGVFTALLILTVTMGIRWHLELRLLWKDRFCKLEEHDDRQYDIFVCYDEADASFVLVTLVPFLEKCQYRCYAWERDSLAGEWITEIYVQSVQKSRRFLLVLSQALVVNPWCTFALYVAVDAMLKQRSRVICIILQEIDWSSVPLNNDQKNLTLQQILRIVRTIPWKPGGGPGSHRFWSQLRLYLPPRRNACLHVQVPTSDLGEFSTPPSTNPSTPCTLSDENSSKVALLSVNISSVTKC